MVNASIVHKQTAEKLMQLKAAEYQQRRTELEAARANVEAKQAKINESIKAGNTPYYDAALKAKQEAAKQEAEKQAAAAKSITLTKANTSAEITQNLKAASNQLRTGQGLVNYQQIPETETQIKLADTLKSEGVYNSFSDTMLDHAKELQQNGNILQKGAASLYLGANSAAKQYEEWLDNNNAYGVKFSQGETSKVGETAKVNDDFQKFWANVSGKLFLSPASFIRSTSAGLMAAVDKGTLLVESAGESIQKGNITILGNTLKNVNNDIQQAATAWKTNLGESLTNPEDLTVIGLSAAVSGGAGGAITKAVTKSGTKTVSKISAKTGGTVELKTGNLAIGTITKGKTVQVATIGGKTKTVTKGTTATGGKVKAVNIVDNSGQVVKGSVKSKEPVISETTGDLVLTAKQTLTISKKGNTVTSKQTVTAGNVTTKRNVKATTQKTGDIVLTEKTKEVTGKSKKIDNKEKSAKEKTTSGGIGRVYQKGHKDVKEVNNTWKSTTGRVPKSRRLPTTGKTSKGKAGGVGRVYKKGHQDVKEVNNTWKSTTGRVPKSRRLPAAGKTSKGKTVKDGYKVNNQKWHTIEIKDGTIIVHEMKQAGIGRVYQKGHRNVKEVNKSKRTVIIRGEVLMSRRLPAAGQTSKGKAGGVGRVYKKGHQDVKEVNNTWKSTTGRVPKSRRLPAAGKTSKGKAGGVGRVYKKGHQNVKEVNKSKRTVIIRGEVLTSRRLPAAGQTSKGKAGGVGRVYKKGHQDVKVIDNTWKSTTGRIPKSRRLPAAGQTGKGKTVRKGYRVNPETAGHTKGTGKQSKPTAETNDIITVKATPKKTAGTGQKANNTSHETTVSTGGGQVMLMRTKTKGTTTATKPATPATKTKGSNQQQNKKLVSQTMKEIQTGKISKNEGDFIRLRAGNKTLQEKAIALINYRRLKGYYNGSSAPKTRQTAQKQKAAPQKTATTNKQPTQNKGNSSTAGTTYTKTKGGTPAGKKHRNNSRRRIKRGVLISHTLTYHIHKAAAPGTVTIQRQTAPQQTAAVTGTGSTTKTAGTTTTTTPTPATTNATNTKAATNTKTNTTTTTGTKPKDKTKEDVKQKLRRATAIAAIPRTKKATKQQEVKPRQKPKRAATTTKKTKKPKRLLDIDDDAKRKRKIAKTKKPRTAIRIETVNQLGWLGFDSKKAAKAKRIRY